MTPKRLQSVLRGVPVAVALSVAALVPCRRAAADEPLGLYLGGAVGQSQVEANSGGNILSPYDHFRENHSAYKIIAGLRPISLFGAELSYIDFGDPTGTLGGAPADASLKGSAAFALLYLPIPVVGVYAKAGVARLQSTVNGNISLACPGGLPPCRQFAPFHVNRTDTSLAGGVGAQLKLGSWALRAEYELFSAAGRNPALFSVGATWSF